MSDVPQPTSGSLYARVIRACTKHNNKCALNCPRRTVEDLGEIASFSMPDQPTEPSLVRRLQHLFRRDSA